MLVPSLRADTAVEREFAHERKALACVNGSTDEPSCGGTDIDIYLRGDTVRKLDWWVEKSNQWVREEYFFRGTRPVLVIETIERKYDFHAEPLRELQLVSRTRYRLDPAATSPRVKEFRDHVEFLLRDFRNRRSEFTRCIRPHAYQSLEPTAGRREVHHLILKPSSTFAMFAAASSGSAPSR